MAKLDSSYRWLQRREFSFPLALDLILKQMHQAARDARRANFTDYAGEAVLLVDRSGNLLQRGVVRLECAVAYSLIDSFDETRDVLHQVIALFQPAVEASRDHKHYYAVANWLVGELLGSSPFVPRVEILLAWQTCLDAFEGLVFHPANISGEEKWYRERYQGMCARIEEFINRDQTPTPPESQTPILLPEEWPMAELHSGGHQVLEVVGKIPAGGFGPTGSDPFCMERINMKPEMKIFRLSGTYHRMYNLRGTDRIVRLNPAGRYFLLQVTGDSMNRANIQEGDYILIRKQETAKDGDIVAAGVRTEDDLATLKRYRERNGKIILQPESTNEEWKPREFSREDLLSAGNAWKLRIHGVALAVFKPSHKPGL